MALVDKRKRAEYDASPRVRRANYGYQKRRYEKYRLEAILRYGGKCACCGEKELVFLTIDHVNGGGSAHRKAVGNNIGNWLRKNGYPSGYRVLCHNCNWAFHKLGHCAHEHSGNGARVARRPHKSEITCCECRSRD